MWTQYKKTFLPIQALILTVCGILYWLTFDPRNVLTVLIIMQAGSLYGASMGARWKRRIQAATDTLPLSRRKARIS